VKHLPESVLKYVQDLSENDAKQVVDTVRENPGAIHALHDDLTPAELLAIAAVFLQCGIGTLENYTPTASTILERVEQGEKGLIPTMEDITSRIAR
jgi:hypothetical protein